MRGKSSEESEPDAVGAPDELGRHTQRLDDLKRIVQAEKPNASVAEVAADALSRFIQESAEEAVVQLRTGLTDPKTMVQSAKSLIEYAGVRVKSDGEEQSQADLLRSRRKLRRENAEETE